MSTTSRFSLLTQTGIILTVISLLAVVGIASSVFITQTTQGAASAINISGSLRMYSYRIATQINQTGDDAAQSTKKIRELMRRFEQQLNHPKLLESIPKRVSMTQNGTSKPLLEQNPLRTLYLSVHGQWFTQIKPILADYIRQLAEPGLSPVEVGKIHTDYQQQYLLRIEDFVFNINNMVKLIEEQTESKIKLLRDIEYISLPLLLLSILAAPFLLYYRILLPLKDLLQIAEQVRRRDFSRQAKYVREDELGELARAFNLMNSDLSATYAELEERIMEKTQALIEESNRITLMEERNTIAQELHDSLAQSIFYLKIQISRIRTLTGRDAPPAELLPVIEELAETNNTADRQLRELISTFRIKVNPEGLTAAVEEIINRQMERSGIALEFDNQIPDFSFTHNEEVHLIQIIQEAVSNIIKHAGATQGTILLDQDAESGDILLTIRDNGAGIPEDPHRTNHFGLKTMEERAESIRGIFSIRPMASGGTEIRLAFTPTLSQESRL